MSQAEGYVETYKGVKLYYSAGDGNYYFWYGGVAYSNTSLAVVESYVDGVLGLGPPVPAPVPTPTPTPTPPPVSTPIDVLIMTYKGIPVYFSGDRGMYWFVYLGGGTQEWAASLADAAAMIDADIARGTPDTIVERYRGVDIIFSTGGNDYYFTYMDSAPQWAATVADAHKMIDELIGSATPAPPAAPSPAAPPTSKSILDRFMGFGNLPTGERLMVGGLVVGGMLWALLSLAIPKRIRHRGGESD
jgi:hypothetical protein